jgi:hypothetical protein
VAPDPEFVLPQACTNSYQILRSQRAASVCQHTLNATWMRARDASFNQTRTSTHTNAIIFIAQKDHFTRACGLFS